MGGWMKTEAVITEDALAEQIKAYYEATSAGERKDGEFSKGEFMRINSIPRKNRDYAGILLDEAVKSGKMTSRDGTNSARPCIWYRFVVE